METPRVARPTTADGGPAPWRPLGERGPQAGVPAGATWPTVAAVDAAIRGLVHEPDPVRIVRIAEIGLALDRVAECREPLRRAVDAARGGRAASAAFGLLCAADVASGRWLEAGRLAEEGLALCGPARPPVDTLAAADPGVHRGGPRRRGADPRAGRRGRRPRPGAGLPDPDRRGASGTGPGRPGARRRRGRLPARDRRRASRTARRARLDGPARVDGPRRSRGTGRSGRRGAQARAGHVRPARARGVRPVRDAHGRVGGARRRARGRGGTVRAGPCHPRCRTLALRPGPHPAGLRRAPPTAAPGRVVPRRARRRVGHVPAARGATVDREGATGAPRLGCDDRPPGSAGHGRRAHSRRAGGGHPRRHRADEQGDRPAADGLPSWACWAARRAASSTAGSGARWAP